MSNISYNPYRAAFSALVSPEAQQYYVRRSVEDITATIGVISALGVVAYWLGGQARQLMAAVQDNSSLLANVSEYEAKPGQQLLLPPAKEPQPQSQESAIDAWVLNAITPSCAALSLIKSIERTDKSLQLMLPPTPTVEPKPQTVTQLRKLAKDLGIKKTSRMTRMQLLDAIAQ